MEEITFARKKRYERKGEGEKGTDDERVPKKWSKQKTS
jgi:hypothetical protein